MFATQGMESTDELLNILQGYSALVPPKRLTFPVHLPFMRVHDFFLNTVLLDSHLAEYPPSDYYQATFWKWALSCLEAAIPDDEDVEIDHRFYDQQVSLLRSQGPMLQAPPPSFVTYYYQPEPSVEEDLGKGSAPLARRRITLLESRTTIESGTTGLRTWGASLALARFLISRPELVRHKAVLELGAGVGFVGIVTADLQATGSNHGKTPSICLTDVNDEVLQRCGANIHLPCNISSQHGNIMVGSLDWNDALSDVSNLEKTLDEFNPDIILGADIVYHPDIIPALVTTLEIALQARGQQHRTAFLALTVRNEDTLKQFLSTAGEAINVETISWVECSDNLLLPPPEGHDQEVRIFKLTAKP